MIRFLLAPLRDVLGLFDLVRQLWKLRHLERPQERQR